MPSGQSLDLSRYPGLVLPRFATQRDYSRATYGNHYALIAASLGQPYIPWQKYVADVLGEIDSNGVRVYDFGVVTVQRQAGKTTTMQSIQIGSAFSAPGRRSWFTAQTGQDANDRFRETIEAFKGSPILKHMGSARLSNGSMWIRSHHGSVIRPHPPTAKALHGKQSDDHDSDEVWEWTAVKGAEIRQAVRPTMQNRMMINGQRPQRRLWSTEGTVESTYFNPILDEYRESIPPNVAFFDFGIPDDVDPFDLDAIARHHPGYGYLFDMSALEAAREEFKDAPSEFARAYGNRRTGAQDRLIPADAMTAARWQNDFPTVGATCLAAAAGVDGVDGAISVSTRVNAGTVVSKLIRDGYGAGTHWMLPTLQQVTEQTGVPVVIDKKGPSAALYDACVLAKVPLVDIDAAGVATAHTNTFDGITRTPPGWRWVPDQHIDAAAELVTKKYWSDGSWIFGRRASVGSIAAIEAPALSSWGVDHLPEKPAFQLF